MSAATAVRAARRADLAAARVLAAVGDIAAARALLARHGISYISSAELYS